MAEMVESSFKDQADRIWHLRFTGKTMRECLQELNVNICDAVPDPGGFVGKLSPPVVMGIIWIAIREEASKRFITEDDFYNSLAGQTLMDMSRAFYGAMLNFSQPQQAIAPMKKVLERGLRLGQMQADQKLAALNGTLDSMTDEEYLKMLDDPEKFIKSFSS